MKQIKLTQGKTAFVDDADFEWLSQWKWCARLSRKPKYPWEKQIWYAVRGAGPRGHMKIIKMHRLLINALPGRGVDHKDGNSLNNQRDNLRHANNKQNARNKKKSLNPNLSSKFKGVSLQMRWRARIRNPQTGKELLLGYFKTEEEAARAYDVAAKKFFGEFASTNF